MPRTPFGVSLLIDGLGQRREASGWPVLLACSSVHRRAHEGVPKHHPPITSNPSASAEERRRAGTPSRKAASDSKSEFGRLGGDA